MNDPAADRQSQMALYRKGKHSAWMNPIGGGKVPAGM
jgi:hypothetical protein